MLHNFLSVLIVMQAVWGYIYHMKFYHFPGVVTLSVVLILGGCGIDPTVLKFEPFHNQTFSARKNKAARVNEQSMELISQGYILLGYIDLKQNIKSCYPDTGCQNIRDLYRTDEEDEVYISVSNKKEYPREDELEFEAAEVGGDKVSVLEEKDVQKQISKQICTYMYPVTYTVEGKTYTYMQCGGYRTIFGVLYSRIKRALVWRLEPTLAASEQNINALKLALGTIGKEEASQGDKE